MSEKPNQPSGRPVPSEAAAARLMSRRQFTRAGLAAPVVLGALASKPVLGQDGAPYNCTISGQVSGNLSSPGDFDCATLGFTPKYWTSNPDDTAMGTLFSDVFLANAFGLVANVSTSDKSNTNTNTNSNSKYSANRARDKGQGKGTTGDQTTVKGESVTTWEVKAFARPGFSTGDSATLLQVLSMVESSDDVKLGRQAVASLFNSRLSASRYPLSPTQVINIFNQVWANGSFYINPTVSWTRAQVIAYLRSLNGRS